MPRRTRRHLWWLIPTLLVVGIIGWIGIRGLIAKNALEEAQALIGDLKGAAAEMDLNAVAPIYSDIAERTSLARSLTADPVWRAGEVVPFLGKNLEVVRLLAAATDDVIIAAEPLVGVAAELDPASLAPRDGAIPLEPFETAAPLVEKAADAIVTVYERAENIDASGTIGPVAGARDRFLSLLGDVVPSVESAREIIPLLPALLGADGPRTYVIAFQNNAEARSLGGTALSFARLTIDGGRIQLEESLPAGFRNFSAFEQSPVPVPDGFEEIYPGAFGRFIPNATLRPDFPSAAEIIYQNWVQRRGVTPDAVLSIDAVALSYVLEATGPVSLSSGDVIDNANAVSFLLNAVLLRYQTGDANRDNLLQDKVYGETVSQTFGKLSSGEFDVPTMMYALLQAFSEQRMMVWSSHPEEQARIAAAGLDSALPRPDGNSDFVGFYVNDRVGSKLNYYLKASLTTESAVCSPDGRQVHRLSAALYNLVEPTTAGTLGPSILGEYAKHGLAPGEQRMVLFVYAPPGSTFLGATVSGQPVELQPLHDTDYPVARIDVSPTPGTNVGVTVDILMGEPGERELDARVTPLVKPVERAERPLDCATVTLPAA